MEKINVDFVSLIAPAFKRAHRDIIESKDTDPRSPTYGQKLREYFFRGGRGSTKSSFISLEIVRHIAENPKSNAVVFVRVAENIRDSVYKQILWAIDHLELNDKFKCTTSPFRCVYLPTGQEILFRGLDKAGKIKGIKPSRGYFDIIWFEELTEFNGMADCRSVIQSVLRGGDEDDDEVGENVRTWEFYSYNPPPTISNWVNIEANTPTPGRKVYDSNYLTVNPRWLRRDFIEKASNLKISNPRAYAHEYLGWVTGTGGNIFNNLEIRNITDAEIFETFDNRCFGIDWGFANDPFVWLAMNYNRNHQILYIFDEIVALGKRTQETAELVRKKMERIGGSHVIYADCAEPDSIADYNAWGVKVEGAPKPHGAKWSGRDYEFKALQDLKKIVIDKQYCPYAAKELQRLEYPKNAHGEFLSEYPHTDVGDACTRWNTEVITRQGKRKIGDLAGCRAIDVLSFDVQCGEFEFSEGVFIRKTRDNAEMVRVELEDGRFVECTQDHKILTENRGWVEAGCLTESDFVVCEERYKKKAVNVKRVVKLREREPVFDLTVPKNHNFVVNDGIVVHNCRYGTFFALREAGILTI